MIRKSFNEDWTVETAQLMEMIPSADRKTVTLPHDRTIEERRRPLRDGAAPEMIKQEALQGGWPTGAYKYSRDFFVPEEWRSKSVYFEFEGVYRDAHVIIDGDFVMHHANGYTAFTVCADDFLRYGKQNNLTVLSRNGADTRWYAGAGIYRPVHIMIGNLVHIAPEGVHFHTESLDNQAAIVKAQFAVRNRGHVRKTVTVTTRIYGPDGSQAAENVMPVTIFGAGEETVAQKFYIDNPSLWDADHPTLYTASTAITDEDTELDRCGEVFGIRSMTLDAVRGLRINGKTVKLRGGAIHSDNGLLGMAEYEAAAARRVRKMKSPVLCSDLFAGERYDARMEQPGWDAPGSLAGENWEGAVCAEWSYNNLVAQSGQPVRPVMTLPVKELLTAPDGEQILDFGQVVAGRIRMHVHESAGTKIVITCTEGLDENGNFFDNNPTADQRIEYISNGIAAGYEPHFTFQGFRYIVVSGVTALRPEDYCAVILSSDKEDAGSFACSDERINRLFENTRWSQRANMISIPTDCPQREKAGWLGDIQVYTRTAMQNEDLTPFLTRWLRNMSLEQKENGSLPMVVPLAGAYVGQYMMQEQQGQCPGAAAPAGWSDAAVLVPWYMYEITGNTLILRQQYETMKRWCDFVLHTAKDNRPPESTLPDEIEQYLWDTGYHYGEHLIPSYSRNGYGPETFMAIAQSTRYVAPIYGWYSVSTFARIAQLLGEDQDATVYGDYADKIKNAIRNGVIGPNGEMPAELMGAYAMPLFFGLVPEHLVNAFREKLVTSIEENGHCLNTGFLGTPVLQDVLCRMGRADLAYDLLFQTKAPSWLYEVEHGATTIWESWFAMDEDGKPFISHMGEYTFTMSLNHYAFGCVDDWMFRSITGLNSVGAGFKRIRIAPVLDDRLRWAERSFESEYGTIFVRWEQQGGNYRLETKIPCNTTAEICLPDGSTYEVGSGRYEYTCEM